MIRSVEREIGAFNSRISKEGGMRKILGKLCLGIVLLALVLTPVQLCGQSFICGDTDANGMVNIADVVYVITYIFGGGPSPDPLLAGDVDCDGTVNIADVVFLINYIFAGGPEPCAVPTGILVDYAGCKTFTRGSAAGSTPPDQDCIEYQYDGARTLLLKHINAGFNCCPVIAADITIEGNLITIHESESFDSTGPCWCLCLFDLDLEISNLSPGEYTISVIEVCTNPEDEILEFTVNLVSSPSGMYCVFRDHYPWGFY